MKKEAKTEITKERIMTAAMREFGEKGYFAASLNNICGTGIPKGLLYHNFKNKDALYLACVEKSFSALTAYLKNRTPAQTCADTWMPVCAFFRKTSMKHIFF